MSAFPDELYQLPRPWAERAYPNLIHYDKLPEGGHVAAWEHAQYMTRVRWRWFTASPENECCLCRVDAVVWLSSSREWHHAGWF